MKSRILIADDDREVRESLAQVLEAEGYAVSLAKTGREAFAALRSQPADLVLLDIKMPKVGGWEALEMMSVLNPFLPVILITGFPGARERGQSVGVEAVLEKPLDLPLLLQTIRRLLAETERKRAGRILSRLHDRLSARASATGFARHSEQPHSPAVRNQSQEVRPLAAIKVHE